MLRPYVHTPSLTRPQTTRRRRSNSSALLLLPFSAVVTFVVVLVPTTTVCWRDEIPEAFFWPAASILWERGVKGQQFLTETRKRIRGNSTWELGRRCDHIVRYGIHRGGRKLITQGGRNNRKQRPRAGGVHGGGVKKRRSRFRRQKGEMRSRGQHRVIVVVTPPTTK